MEQTKVPEPPTTDGSQSHFVCQICSVSTPSHEAAGDLWKQHVIRDLWPYTCVLESCTSAQTSFGTFDEWIMHMEECQKDSSSDVFASCPLCDCQRVDYYLKSSDSKGREALQAHVAAHLQSLTLLSFGLHYSTGKSELQKEKAEESHNCTQSSFPVFTLRNYYEPHSRLHGSEVLSGDVDKQSSNFADLINPRVMPRYLPMGSSTNGAPVQAGHIHGEIAPKVEALDILVVEDNPINRKVLSKILKKHHHMVVCAYDGKLGLDAFKKRKYDVILMDLTMPVMDGITATEHIRKYERQFGITRTPIIAMTVLAYMKQDNWDNLLQRGMDFHLNKPLRSSVLSIVEHYGSLGRNAARNDLHRFMSLVSIGKGQSSTSSSAIKSAVAKL